MSRLRLRSLVARAAVLAAIAGFLALGFWQLERRQWKLALIDQVEARLAADPVPAPGPEAWGRLTAAESYLKVRATGRFRHDLEVPVLAVTGRGSGYWVLTPLETGGFTVLVNRGFVPPDRRDPAGRPEGQTAGGVTVTGLLRVTEPGGGFLRANDPGAGRWYSRDVGAIVAAKGVAPPTAPYFIDADATPNPGGLPAGGLTVVRFRNNHLSYALTWFAMAAGLAALSVWATRRRRP